MILRRVIEHVKAKNWTAAGRTFRKECGEEIVKAALEKFKIAYSVEP